jgi:hypothetical protein
MFAGVVAGTQRENVAHAQRWFAADNSLKPLLCGNPL